jgi:hypothetical protein
MLGLLTSVGVSHWWVSLNIFNYGIYCMRQSSLMMTMSMFGDWKGQASLPQNLHIERSSMAPSPLRLGDVYGNLGRQQSANYFYG